MQAYKRLLEALGSVVTFDYPYMKAGSKRPDPHAKLVASEILDRLLSGSAAIAADVPF